MNKIHVNSHCYPRSPSQILQSKTWEDESASTHKIIALDFDRTLFDTERFKIALAKSLKKYGIAPKIWRQTYKNSIPKNLIKYQIYEPKKHAKIIQKLTGVNANKILTAFHKVIKQSSKFIYKETLPVLKFFINRNFTLYLVSFGNRPHQKEKIRHSGLAKYFQKIIITNKPKASIKFPPPPYPSPSKRGRVKEGVILVDDNPLEIKNLYKKYKNKIKLIWLNRQGKKTPLPKSIKQIQNLKQLTLM